MAETINAEGIGTEQSTVGISESVSEIPDALHTIMRENSRTLDEEMLPRNLFVDALVHLVEAETAEKGTESVWCQKSHTVATSIPDRHNRAR